MKINKTLIILSLLLIFCISLGAVSAADSADMSVNDINNDDIATVESSVNVDEEISTVSEEGQINKSSEIYDEIKSATGTYNITTDYQIGQTWEIPNANVIIEGNNHTIYGNGNQAFKITGNNVTIQNLNFVNCSATSGYGGAIYFSDSSSIGNVSGCSFVNCSTGDSGYGVIYFWGDGSVGNCSFVNCSSYHGGAIYFLGDGNVSGCSFVNCSSYDGGAIFFAEGSGSSRGFVSGCSFVNCSSRNKGGAIYFTKCNVSVNYCIFDNNDAKLGKAIFIRNMDYDVNYNFFAFQNKVIEFPDDLISCYGEPEEYNITPENWVVLNISNSGDEYAIKFVDAAGLDLTNIMPDYDASLRINDGDAKEITIKNNSFSETLVNGSYEVRSLNTEDLLAENKLYSDSFAALNDLIRNNAPIELTHNYTFYFGSDEEFIEGIEIGDNVVIDGKGYTIDGSAIARVFNIIADNVTLKNINFINCYSYNDGGAIYSKGSFTVVDCSFVGCRAVNGGAICSLAGDDFNSYLNVSGCSFVNCSATGDGESRGGAIYSESDNCSVMNCSFVGCFASDFGGAIYSLPGGIINYNIFENNEAEVGSAIYISTGEGNVDYNFFAFESNITEFPSNLVFGVDPKNWVILNITNDTDSYFVKFVLNNGTDLDKFMLDYDVKLTMSGNSDVITIQNNTFKGDFEETYYTVRSVITGNKLVELKYGGIPDDSFTVLNASVANGSVILSHDYKFYDGWDDEFVNGIEIGDNVIIEGNNFTITGNNFARIFNIMGDNVTLKNINFINGYSYNDGGAIYSEGSLSIVGCSFVNCFAGAVGGAIFSESDDCSVSGCSFVNCSANVDVESGGGAIFAIGTINVWNCSFVNCSANVGGAICSVFVEESNCSVSVIVSDCSFVGCSADDGGAIYYSMKDNAFNITNCSFVGCSADDGGAIYSLGDSLTVVGCSFVNCNASMSGGAIYSLGDSLTVVGCSFVNCNASRSGGAIYSRADLFISACNFINCNCNSFGGAICSEESNLVVSGCSFVGCSADDGGAISSSGSYGVSCSVSGCSFVGCSADDGGAIYSGESSVMNCSFVNCSAGNVGGAIYSGESSVMNCSFVGCSAGDAGGAICSEYGIFNYNIFDNNDATHGKAIFILNNGSNVNSNFFAFQNNVTDFPNDLISYYEESGEYSNITPNNWIVLNISYANSYYFVSFVLNDGSALEKSMPDYDVNLTINGVSEVITVSDNTFKHINKAGDYLITSLASGEVLATATIPISNVSDYSVVTFDCDYGDIAKVGVLVPNGVTGTVSVNVSGKVFTSDIKEGIAIVLLTGLNAGNYVLDVSYSGSADFLPFNTTANVTVNKIHIIVTPTALSTTYDSGKYFQVKVANSKGKAVSGLELSLKVYTGSSYKTVIVTTDANGIAKYSASKLSIATHKVVINVPNTNYFVDKKTDSSIKVSKAPTTVTAKKVTYRKGAKKYFSVTIKNKATGKVVKSLTLKIKVYTGKKYKTYTVKTNSKGIAKLSTKALKKGTHKVVISTTSKYYTVSKSGKLIVIK